MGFIIGTPDRNYSRVCDLGRGGYIPNFPVQKVELHINKYSFKHENYGATCTVCNVLHNWSSGRMNEQQNNFFPDQENNTAAG